MIRGPHRSTPLEALVQEASLLAAKGVRELLLVAQDTTYVRFERLGVFTYSEEEGTYGAQHYKDSISEKVKQERYHRIMELQADISFAYNQSRVGTKELVLIDRKEGARWAGRTQFESPEVDGEVYVDISQDDNHNLCGVGTFKEVVIRRAEAYDLYGELYFV